MKQRNKYILEGAIVELVHNEYDRLLAIDDMMTNIDSQKYLGGVTEEEGTKCLEAMKEVKELKDKEIDILQKLSKEMFEYVRPVKKEEEKKEEIEGQITVEELEEKKGE